MKIFDFKNMLPSIKSFLPISGQKKITVKETEKYYKHKDEIQKIILSQTESHEIIHGEFAVQKYLPKSLHRHTGDIDIFSPRPREDARETEMALDKKFHGDLFFITRGQHPGTWRVISYNTGESVADYTEPEGKIPHKRIDGKNYVTLEYLKKKTISILNDPQSEFRHAKDQDTINRIKIAEKKGGRIF